MSKLYPVDVPIKEAQVAKLTKLLESSYTRILGEINTATDFGVANRRKILAQIDEILLDLGTDIQDFVSDTLPQYYRAGARSAVKQLDNVGAEIAVDTGYSQLHKDAIIALIDDTVAAYSESLTGIKRSAMRLLGATTRELVTSEIAFGQISGEGLRRVRQNIKGILQEEGLSALIDKSGKRWSLDNYSDMLYRTKVVEARNMGLINRMVENNYDLVQVSAHSGSCKLCAPWEGKILSSTGATKGYQTVREATDAGLFHPRCRHAINAIIPKLARQTRAYDPQKGALVQQPGESLSR